MNKPNIILLTIDSLRADFVGYQNAQENNTPFLDKLVQESYVYTNAIVPGTPTFICFPSLMTGQLPFKHGRFLGIPDKRGIRTLAETLKENGYMTTAFISENPALYSIYGFDRGFDFYFDGFWGDDTTYAKLGNLAWELKERLPKEVLNTIYTARAFYQTFISSPQISLPGQILNRKIINFMQERAKEPFFLWAHYMDVHFPYFSGLDKYFNFKNTKAENILTKMRLYKNLASCVQRMKIDNAELIEIFKEGYRSCIKYTDKKIGELYKFLKAKYPNSVFFITADHGEGFMRHGRYYHQPFSLYNEFIKVPLLINLPSKENKKIEQVVSLLSLPRTVCSLLDIPEDGFQGNDLIQRNKTSELNKISRILYKCITPHLEIFDNKTEIKGFDELWSYTTIDYKYIIQKDANKEEFYDLRNDPLEKKNIVNSNIKNQIKTDIDSKLRSYMGI